MEAPSANMPRMSIQERIRAMNLAIDDSIADPSAQPVPLAKRTETTQQQPKQKRPSVVDMWRKREENSPKNAQPQTNPDDGPKQGGAKKAETLKEKPLTAASQTKALKPVDGSNAFQRKSQLLAAQLAQTGASRSNSEESFEEKKDQEEYYEKHTQVQPQEKIQQGPPPAPVPSHQPPVRTPPRYSSIRKPLNPENSGPVDITYLPVAESPQRPNIPTSAPAWARRGLENVHLAPTHSNPDVDDSKKAENAASESEDQEDSSSVPRMSVKDMWKKRASGAAALEPATPRWESQSMRKAKQTPPLHSSPVPDRNNSSRDGQPQSNVPSPPKPSQGHFSNHQHDMSTPVPSSPVILPNKTRSSPKQDAPAPLPSSPVILPSTARSPPKPSPSQGASPFGELRSQWAKRESDNNLKDSLAQPVLESHTGPQESVIGSEENSSRSDDKFENGSFAEKSPQIQGVSEQNGSFTRSRAPSRNQLRREALAKHKAKLSSSSPFRNKGLPGGQNTSPPENAPKVVKASEPSTHTIPQQQTTGNGKKKHVMVAKQNTTAPKTTASSRTDDYSHISDALSEAFGDVMSHQHETTLSQGPQPQGSLTHPSFPVKTLSDTGNGEDQFYPDKAVQPNSPLSPASEYASLCVADSDSFAVDHDTTFSPKGPTTPGGDSLFSSTSNVPQPSPSGRGSSLTQRANRMIKQKQQLRRGGYNRPTDLAEVPEKKLGAKSVAQNPDEFSDIVGTSPSSAYRYELGPSSPEASTGLISTATGATGNTNRKSSFSSETSGGSETNFTASSSASDDISHEMIRQRRRGKKTLGAEASRRAMKHLDQASKTMVTDSFVAESNENAQALQKAYESVSLQQIAKDIQEEVSDLNFPSFDFSKLTSSLKIGSFSMNNLVKKDAKPPPTPKNLKIPEVKESFPMEEGVAIEVEFIESSDEESEDMNDKV